MNNHSKVQCDIDLVVLPPVDFLSISADLFDPPLLSFVSAPLHAPCCGVRLSALLPGVLTGSGPVLVGLLGLPVHLNLWISWSVWTTGSTGPYGLLDLLVLLESWISWST